MANKTSLAKYLLLEREYKRILKSKRRKELNNQSVESELRQQNEVFAKMQTLKMQALN